MDDRRRGHLEEGDVVFSSSARSPRGVTVRASARLDRDRTTIHVAKDSRTELLPAIQQQQRPKVYQDRCAADIDLIQP